MRRIAIGGAVLLVVLFIIGLVLKGRMDEQIRRKEIEIERQRIRLELSMERSEQAWKQLETVLSDFRAQVRQNEEIRSELTRRIDDRDRELSRLKDERDRIAAELSRDREEILLEDPGGLSARIESELLEAYPDLRNPSVTFSGEAYLFDDVAARGTALSVTEVIHSRDKIGSLEETVQGQEEKLRLSEEFSETLLADLEACSGSLDSFKVASDAGVTVRNDLMAENELLRDQIANLQKKTGFSWLPKKVIGVGAALDPAGSVRPAVFVGFGWSW